MALVLALVFRARLRLLPLLIALAAAAITFGALSAVGASLTMASIGVLPVLLGLAVDYAIQVQSRVLEERGDIERVARLGRAADRDRRGGDRRRLPGAADLAGADGARLRRAAGHRHRGRLHVRADRGRGAPSAAAWRRPASSAVGPRRAGAGGARCGRAACARTPRRAGVRTRGQRGWRGALGLAMRSPAAVLGVGGRARGGGLGARHADQGRVRRQQARAAEPRRAAGPPGAAEVHRRGRRDRRARARRRHDRPEGRAVDERATRRGWSSASATARRAAAARRSCARPSRCPTCSGRHGEPRRRRSRRCWTRCPPYFSQGVISSDRTVATLAFGIRLMPLERQQQVIKAMRSELHPPAGVSARLAGLPVLAAEANDRVSSPWRRLICCSCSGCWRSRRCCSSRCARARARSCR